MPPDSSSPSLDHPADTPHALFLITSDPMQSPRPAEAVRMAAGIQAWGRVRVTVYFDAQPTSSLASHPDQVQDEDLFRQCLPMLCPPGGKVCFPAAQAGAPEISEWGIEFQAMSEAALAALARQSFTVMRF